MQKIFRTSTILILAMTLLAVAGWFGRKAYKVRTVRRLLEQASQFIDKKDFNNATLCLQRAHQINPNSAKVCDLTADMLDASGSPNALNWRVRAAQLDTNNVAYRFAWAQTALKLQDGRSAGFALTGLDARATNTSVYHKLSGALAWELGSTEEAEKQYLEALR